MELNSYIEHTLLKADTSNNEIKKLCTEALEHNFYGVCVPPFHVQMASKLLEGSDVSVVTVCGFPLGYSPTLVKVAECRKAIEDGAVEVDMVINVAALKDGNYAYVLNDIKSVVTTAHLKDARVKVILETALLNNEEIEKACQLCVEAGADFVKTSTGFSAAGAKVEHIELMRASLPENIKIKASGGIKSHDQAVKLVGAGADRLGTSSGPNLLK